MVKFVPLGLTVSGPSRKLLVAALILLAVELSLLWGDVHLLWAPPRSAPSTARVARVMSIFRQAKVRSPFQLNWITLEAGQELHEGDEVATMEDSRMVLGLEDGQEVALEPNSLLVLGGLNDPHAGRAIQVTLLDGTFQKPPASAAATSSATLAPTAAVQGIRIEANELTTPEPRVPHSGAVLDNPRTVTLSWLPDVSVAGGPTTTLLEVSRHPDLRDPLLVRRLAAGETSFEFLPLLSGRYFWRLSRVDGARRREGPRRDFDVRRSLAAPVLDRPHIERVKLRETPEGLDAPRLGRPVVTYPKHGSLEWNPQRSPWHAIWDWLIPNAQAEETYTVDLAWERVTGASGYRLQIASDDRFEHLSLDQSLSDRAFHWQTPVAGFFYWRVAGVAPGGESGPWSEFKTFSIQAERNREGDETTYDTYLRFDPYARSLHSVRLSWRPSWNNYYFGSNHPTSPAGANYHKQTLVSGQIDYDYKIDAHYSAQFSVGAEKAELDASNFEDRPNQTTRFQTEKTFLAAVERRYFWPRFYISLRGGLSFSYIDIPVQGQNGDLNFQAFGYFGPFVGIGFTRLITSGLSAGLSLSGSFQHTGDSFRASQFASFDLRQKLLDNLGIGVRIQQSLIDYQFNAGSIVGHGHSFGIRPALSLDFNF